MEGLQVTVNTERMQHLLAQYAWRFKDKKRLRRVMANAINRTLLHMRTVAVRGIRETYFVPAGEVRKTMSLRRARPNSNPSGELKFKGNMTSPLIKFGAQQRKKGVSVRVLRSSGARFIQPGGDKKIVKTAKDRAAVWIAKGDVYARVEDRDHPVILYGPSFLSFFNRPGVAEQLRAQSEEFMIKRLRHEAEYALGKEGGR